MICWNFVTSEGIYRILNPDEFVFAWIPGSIAAKSIEYKLLDYTDVLSGRISENPLKFKT